MNEVVTSGRRVERRHLATSSDTTLLLAGLSSRPGGSRSSGVEGTLVRNVIVANSTNNTTGSPQQHVERAPAGAITETVLVEMVFPGQTNHYGTLFGGQAMALMDKAAFIVASRYARRTVVTASSEKCDFHVPVRQGQLVELRASVVSTGRTSMVVEVDLVAEDLLTGDRQLGTRGKFVMVALDAHGKPASVPPMA